MRRRTGACHSLTWRRRRVRRTTRSRCARLCRCRTIANQHRLRLAVHLHRVSVAPLLVVALLLLLRVLLVLAVLAAVAARGAKDRLTKLLVPPPAPVLSLAALLAPVLPVLWLALHRLRALRRNLPPVVQEESRHSVRAMRLSSALCCDVQLVLEGRLLAEQPAEADMWDFKCVGRLVLEVLAHKPGT